MNWQFAQQIMNIFFPMTVNGYFCQNLSMKIEVLFFGMSKDLAGHNKKTMEFDQPLNIGQFREYLTKKYPMFSKLDSFAIAVNESYAKDDVLLGDNETVAIIPPVSGG